MFWFLHLLLKQDEDTAAQTQPCVKNVKQRRGGYIAPNADSVQLDLSTQSWVTFRFLHTDVSMQQLHLHPLPFAARSQLGVDANTKTNASCT